MAKGSIVNYYEEEEIWGNPPEPYQIQVRKDILSVMPRDAHSVLDVGCGDGTITNSLPEDLLAVGVDISRTALRHVERPCFLASIADLPFGEETFDLVMANDVLEHLPRGTYPKGARELARVSKKYVLITVPFMENLRAQRTRCADCGEVYHVNHHQRAFGVKELAEVYDENVGVAPTHFVFSGAQVAPAEEIERGVRSELDLLTEWDRAVCPKCGARRSTRSMTTGERRGIGLLSAAVADAFPRDQPTRNECAVLFEKGRKPEGEGPRREAASLHVFSVGESGSTTEVPFARRVGEATTVEVREETSRARGERICLEWRLGSTAYRYYDPDEKAPHTYSVPSWFSPDVLPRLSSSRPFSVRSRSEVRNALLTFSVAAAREREEKDAEIDTLKLRLGRLDQKEIDLQNARAELDALKLRLGQLEQKETDLQNARAELDALKARLGQLEQKEMDLQNARAELDALNLRLGQLEQKETDLHNARAELDALKLRLRRLEQKEIDLQNARAELASVHQQLGALTREKAEWERASRAALTESQAQAAAFEQERNAHAEGLAAAERQRGAAQSEMERISGELEEMKRTRQDLEARCQSLVSYQEAQQRAHTDLQKAYDRTLARRAKLAVLKLGRNKCEPRRNYEAKILQLAKPSVTDVSWAETASEAERSFLIITHDQEIDRRILQQADALTQDGWRGMIVCVSLDNTDHIDRDAHRLPLHRVGLNRVVPNCKAYWKYHNRQRLIDWWGRWHLRLSRWNLSLYKTQWQWRYRSQKMASPLPFDNAFYEAGRHYRAEVVIAEDLPALPAAARLAREWQVPLIYDSHELYAEQKTFSGAQKRIMRRAEGDLIRQCAATFTVNDSIADEMARRYRCARPHVLLNVVDPPEGFDVGARHERLRKHFCWPGDRVILLFQGGLAANRNLENLVESMAFVRNDRLVLVLMGDGPIKDRLRDAARARDVADRVFFKDAVPQEELAFWTASADIGVIPYPNVDLNTYYCTPNKLFEYIQAGLPILANDLPELRRYVGETGFGVTVAMRKPSAIAAALDAWLSDPAKLRAARETLLAKREEFTWRASRVSFLEIVNRSLRNRDRKD